MTVSHGSYYIDILPWLQYSICTIQNRLWEMCLPWGGRILDACHLKMLWQSKTFPFSWRIYESSKFLEAGLLVCLLLCVSGGLFLIFFLFRLGKYCEQIEQLAPDQSPNACLLRDNFLQKRQIRFLVSHWITVYTTPLISRYFSVTKAKLHKSSCFLPLQ